MKPYFMVLCILLCGCTKPFVIESGDYYVYATFDESVNSRAKNFAAVYLNNGSANIERRTITFEYLEEQEQQDSTYIKTITRKADSAFNYIFDGVPPLERTGYMRFKVVFVNPVTYEVSNKWFSFDITNYKYQNSP